MLAPASLHATAKAPAEAESDHAARLTSFELAAERVRYDAERAQTAARRGRAREPARGPHRQSQTWERTLTEQRRAEADLASQRAHRPSMLTDAEVAWLRRAGADLRRVFDAETTTYRQREQLLRVLAKVVVTVKHTFVERKMRTVNREADHARERSSLVALARSPRPKHPDAAARLRERLDEILTVLALGLPDTLGRT